MYVCTKKNICHRNDSECVCGGEVRSPWKNDPSPSPEVPEPDAKDCSPPSTDRLSSSPPERK